MREYNWHELGVILTRIAHGMQEQITELDAVQRMLAVDRHAAGATVLDAMITDLYLKMYALIGLAEELRNAL